eukprot:GHVO01020050.1.p1 GENE.GHVO01020050.1~~GHVO01020050.1.p1  ORF type:complete len:218 (+),score=16.90 GHVO01020050.1:108-761(+)
MGARLVIGFSNAIGVHARLSIIQSITQYQTSVEMKFATLIGLVASVVHGASQDQITPNSMKQMLMDASQGANLEQFAHKLLAFTDRQERVFADSTCGTGESVIGISVFPQSSYSCNMICMDVFNGMCLEEATAIINRDINSCACIANMEMGLFPVASLSDPLLPAGCGMYSDEWDNVYVAFNDLGKSNQPFGCDSPGYASTSEGGRLCVCSTLAGSL